MHILRLAREPLADRQIKCDYDVSWRATRGQVLYMKTFPPNDHRGALISEDHVDELPLSPLIMDWSWDSHLWNRINAECGTDIDEYEEVWLEATNLRVAARVIRGDLVGTPDVPAEYVTFLSEAPDMLESCAKRHERVMFSL